MSSPTARSLVRLRRCGYTADVAERWVPHANIRRDLFGCIDLVAVHPQEAGVLGIQATTVGHVSERLAKARQLPALKAWLAAGNRFQVWGWVKRGQHWKVKIVGIEGAELADVVVEAPCRRHGGRKPEQLQLFPE